MGGGGFATAVSCIDGRVQEPLTRWIRERFGVEHVDMVTEPGPDLFVATSDEEGLTPLLERIRVSRRAHASSTVVLAGHLDCAANPVSAEEHGRQLEPAAALLAERLPGMRIVTVLVTGCGDRGCLEVSVVGASPSHTP
ncbi:carbonic anhydrase [Nocardiopsis sp. YSL2]|uniref:carbonic anhydrase n=1 Tax=Nocardiopsis sp. YSL2 TaxID=2939492 RepID=UPI0026F45960|nr:carbonic anhydrase [Nocardiopsis sp. YSL2]